MQHALSCNYHMAHKASKSCNFPALSVVCQLSLGGFLCSYMLFGKSYPVPLLFQILFEKTAKLEWWIVRDSILRQEKVKISQDMFTQLTQSSQANSLFTYKERQLIFHVSFLVDTALIIHKCLFVQLSDAGLYWGKKVEVFSKIKTTTKNKTKLKRNLTAILSKPESPGGCFWKVPRTSGPEKSVVKLQPARFEKLIF